MVGWSFLGIFCKFFHRFKLISLLIIFTHPNSILSSSETMVESQVWVKMHVQVQGPQQLILISATFFFFALCFKLEVWIFMTNWFYFGG